MKKILSGLRRMYYLLRPSLHHQQAYKNLLSYLDHFDISYLKNDKEKNALLRVALNPVMTAEFQYYFTGERLIATAKLQTIPEELIREAMVLSAHLNMLVRPSMALISTRQGTANVVRHLDVLSCAMYPGFISSELYSHEVDAQFAADSFDCLIATGDDPVFVIDTVRKKWDKKEADKTNHAD